VTYGVIFDAKGLKDYEYPQIAERFYRDTKDHELTILQDNGLYRHLRMMPPKSKSSCYWYDVITWPGNLVFRGDGETYAFTRLQDMFEFFRSGIYKNGSVHINPSYWAEKLTSNRDCVKTYDQDRFTKYIGQMVLENEESYPGLTDAWNAAVDGFCADYDISHQEGAWEALNNFEYELWRAKCSCGAEKEERERYDVQAWGRDKGHLTSVNGPKPGHKLEIKSRSFTFDPCDMDFKDYDWWFLWALYGIVVAIREYDTRKGHGQSVDIAAAGEVVIIG
jgi:hypothetical protein